MKNFRTYQLAVTLVRQGRGIKMPGVYREQFQRALISVPLNLAEGSAKQSNADRKRFYQIALGSLREVQCLIEILELKEIENQADKVAASLYRLVHSL